jgi:putative transposase
MDVQIQEFNGEADHIHVLIEYPPKLSISSIVNVLKGVSSRRYGQAGYPKPYGKDALWSPSLRCCTILNKPFKNWPQSPFLRMVQDLGYCRST